VDKGRAIFGRQTSKYYQNYIKLQVFREQFKKNSPGQHSQNVRDFFDTPSLSEDFFQFLYFF
jgi:hypothetical protein